MRLNAFWFVLILVLSPMFSLAGGEDPPKRKEPSIADLIEALRDKNKDVRAKAADQLAELGPEAKPALGALVEALKDQEKEVRENAEYAIVRIGPASVPFLVRAFESQDARARRLAAHALEIIGRKARDAVPALIRLLKDKEPSVRQQAVSTLSVIRHRDAVPALMDLFNKESDGDVRREVVVAFADFGQKAGAAVPVLIDLVRTGKLKEDDYATLRTEAAEALAWIGPKAVPSLIEVAKDTKNDHTARETAVYALGAMAVRIGPDAPIAAVPTLIELLNDKDVHLRGSAADALGSIGPNAIRAVPGLTQSLKDPSALNRVKAAGALYQIAANTELTLPILIDELKNNKDRSIRLLAVVTLNELGPNAAAAVPVLTETLADVDVNVRLNAANALGRVGPGAKAAIPALMKTLKKDKSPYVRGAASQALSKIAGPGG